MNAKLKPTIVFILFFSLGTLGYLSYSCSVNDIDANANSGFTLTSSSFGTVIPSKHANSPYGTNTSPQLAWQNAPAGTMLFYIIMQDLQSLAFSHWIISDIPTTTSSTAEGINPLGGNVTVLYSGPAPPPTATHTYVITIYAVDKNITTSTNTSTMKANLDADNLGNASISGTFTATFP